MNFKKHGTGNHGNGGANGRVEALQVTDLHNAAMFRGKVH
jgi:hypothetical protein